ncbi:MAG: MmcQ/YjbR family DNA-binding protein [Sediminibacterium sp.]
MVSITTFRNIALSFPDAEEQPHFHLASFRVKKKIFATLWVKENRAMLKLSLTDQSVFCTCMDIFYPVPGAWGAKGATFVDLSKVRPVMFKDALQAAYSAVAIQKKAIKKINAQT